MKTKQTKKYVAPEMEFIEMEPREVLCASSTTDGALFQFQVGTTGQWDGGVVAP